MRLDLALSIMGTSEAVRAWKLLSKFNNLIAPVQDGLASMKNGRALLESLSPNELSRLSQFRSDDVIYSLMDNMKNGKIGGGITLDEYINIRQQKAKSVGVVVDAAGNGAKTTVNNLPEVKAPNAMPKANAVDSWNSYLGKGQTNINPVTGKPDANRIFSADGTRSIRYGTHEMTSPVNKEHFHFETWTFDAGTNAWNVENILQRLR